MLFAHRTNVSVSAIVFCISHKQTGISICIRTLLVCLKAVERLWTRDWAQNRELITVLWKCQVCFVAEVEGSERNIVILYMLWLLG